MLQLKLELKVTSVLGKPFIPWCKMQLAFWYVFALHNQNVGDLKGSLL